MFYNWSNLFDVNLTLLCPFGHQILVLRHTMLTFWTNCWVNQWKVTHSLFTCLGAFDSSIGLSSTMVTSLCLSKFDTFETILTFHNWFGLVWLNFFGSFFQSCLPNSLLPVHTFSHIWILFFNRHFESTICGLLFCSKNKLLNICYLFQMLQQYLVICSLCMMKYVKFNEWQLILNNCLGSLHNFAVHFCCWNVLQKLILFLLLFCQAKKRFNAQILFCFLIFALRLNLSIDLQFELLLLLNTTDIPQHCAVSQIKQLCFAESPVTLRCRAKKHFKFAFCSPLPKRPSRSPQMLRVLCTTIKFVKC